MNRNVRDEGVAGSNPATPTNLSQAKSRVSEIGPVAATGHRDSYRDRNASLPPDVRGAEQSRGAP
jgi:hypothetical protein